MLFEFAHDNVFSAIPDILKMIYNLYLDSTGFCTKEIMFNHVQSLVLLLPVSNLKSYTAALTFNPSTPRVKVLVIKCGSNF